jgi:hypothetical protein
VRCSLLQKRIYSPFHEAQNENKFKMFFFDSTDFLGKKQTVLISSEIPLGLLFLQGCGDMTEVLVGQLSRRTIRPLVLRALHIYCLATSLDFTNSMRFHVLVFVPRPKLSKQSSYINWRFFVVAALPIKPKQQHEKAQNKNTGLFINCMDFVVLRTKNKQKITSSFFLSMLGP